MDALENAWKHLKISEEEEEVVQVESGDNPWEGIQLPLCLAGKLLTTKKFNEVAMKNTLYSAWNLEKDAIVRRIGENFFIFQFLSQEDKTSVLERSPWCFDDQLLLLAEVPGDVSPSQITFTQTYFWVHLLEVPLGCRNEATIRALGDKLGGYITHDKEDPLLMGESIRVRVRHNISKPLFRKLAIQVGEKKCGVGVKYERLPLFCYCCGRLGHQAKDCDDEQAKCLSRDYMQYGTWLHAQKTKWRLRPSRVELEQETAWLNSLKTEKDKGMKNSEALGRNPMAGLEAGKYEIGMPSSLNEAVDPMKDKEGSGFIPSTIPLTCEPTTLEKAIRKSERVGKYEKTKQSSTNEVVDQMEERDGPPLLSTTTQPTLEPTTKETPTTERDKAGPILNIPTKQYTETNPNTKSPIPILDIEMSHPQSTRSKRKIEDLTALVSTPLGDSGQGKKHKGEMGIAQITSPVADMAGAHVREEP